jgi:hypothetical protein
MTPFSIYVILGNNLSPTSYDLRFVGFEYSKKLSSGKSEIEINQNYLQKNDFIAPEIITNGNASIESDIYSAGKILELLGLSQIKGIIDNK